MAASSRSNRRSSEKREKPQLLGKAPQRAKAQHQLARAPKLFGRAGLDISPNKNGRVWLWSSTAGWRATLSSFRGATRWDWSVVVEGYVIASRFSSGSLTEARSDLTATIKSIRRAIESFTGRAK